MTCSLLHARIFLTPCKPRQSSSGHFQTVAVLKRYVLADVSAATTYSRLVNMSHGHLTQYCKPEARSHTMQAGRLQNQLDYEEARDLEASLAKQEEALQKDRAHLSELKQQETQHRSASEAIEQQLQSHVSLDADFASSILAFRRCIQRRCLAKRTSQQIISCALCLRTCITPVGNIHVTCLQAASATSAFIETMHPHMHLLQGHEVLLVFTFHARSILMMNGFIHPL